MSNAPYWQSQPGHRETHREYLERRDIGGSEPSPLSQYAIWHLADRLAAIDEAENATAPWARQIAAATLAGRTPEQARADAHAKFAAAYSAAVALEAQTGTCPDCRGSVA